MAKTVWGEYAELKTKLIALLKDSPSLDAMDDNGYAMGADHLIANGVTILTEPKCDKINVKLPEDDFPKDSKRKLIRCLVYTDKGTVKQCSRQRCISRKVNGEWVFTPWEWNKDIFAKPTHWMPLPEPPKGE